MGARQSSEDPGPPSLRLPFALVRSGLPKRQVCEREFSAFASTFELETTLSLLSTNGASHAHLVLPMDVSGLAIRYWSELNRAYLAPLHSEDGKVITMANEHPPEEPHGQ
jgi:hypothetical protein